MNLTPGFQTSETDINSEVPAVRCLAVASESILRMTLLVDLRRHPSEWFVHGWLVVVEWMIFSEIHGGFCYAPEQR